MPPAVTPAEPTDDLVPLGTVRGALGVHGWIRVALYAADGAVLQGAATWWLRQADGWRSLTILGSRRRGTQIVAQCAEVKSKEAADALKGSEVAVPRSEFPRLPPGEHYVRDLLGCRVINRQGIELGKVVDVRESGPARWLEIEGSGGKLLVPLNEQYVERIDAAARQVDVDWQDDW